MSEKLSQPLLTRVLYSLISIGLCILFIVFSGLQLNLAVSLQAQQSILINSVVIGILSLIIIVNIVMLFLNKIGECTHVAVQVVLAVVYIAVVLTFIFLYFGNELIDIPFGPLNIPFNDGTNVFFYTDENISFKILIDDDLTIESPTKFHSVLTDKKNFTLRICTSQCNSYSFTQPQTIKQFTVTADVHGNAEYAARANNSKSDFHMVAGDLSYWGEIDLLQNSLNYNGRKPQLICVGNHDTPGYISEIVRRDSFNYYQRIGDVGIFSLFVFAPDPGTCTVSNEKIDEAIALLYKYVNDDQVKNQFIIVHHPFYSPGEFGSNKYLATSFETFLDANPTAKIRAVFTGHDHILSAFKRNNMYVFVNSCGGGRLDYISDPEYTYKWGQDEIHGPLISSGTDYEMGFQYHLDSFVRYTRTDVGVEGGRIVYVAVDLDTGEEIVRYEQVI